MMANETNGLATAEKLYREYGGRARQLRESGRKVVGYLTALGPIEILTAADVVPLRLKGNPSEPVTKADTHMETIVCPFIRNVYDSALKGRYSYVDGLVLPHQCDSTDKTSNAWLYTLNLPYFHFLNVPHVTSDASIDFFCEVLRVFIASLERFTGTKITDEVLATAIAAHNANRRLMRALYDLRKSNPPLISGTEMMWVLVAAMSLPVEESSVLIERVTVEVTERELSFEPRPRLMLVGDQIDDTSVVAIIEGFHGWLVMDNLSMGSKMYWEDVDSTPDPLRGIAERYLRKLKLPTTYVASGGTYAETMDLRFGHIKRFAEEFSVDGVILFIYKYCDPYGFEVPALKSFIESAGIPVLYLEDEYASSSRQRVKTRIEAFLEMIAG